MTERFCLGHKKAKKFHNSIIEDGNSYSLTVTLKPYYNSMPVNEQFRMFSNELINLLVKLNRYYNILMFTPEFTKDFNIHFHIYFVLPDDMDIEVFNQNFKRLRLKKSCIGPNYKLKKVDSVTDILREYPFKDVERTLKYSKIDNCLFQPYHGIIKGLNPWKII